MIAVVHTERWGHTEGCDTRSAIITHRAPAHNHARVKVSIVHTMLQSALRACGPPPFRQVPGQCKPHPQKCIPHPQSKLAVHTAHSEPRGRTTASGRTCRCSPHHCVAAAGSCSPRRPTALSATAATCGFQRSASGTPDPTQHAGMGAVSRGAARLHLEETCCGVQQWRWCAPVAAAACWRADRWLSRRCGECASSRGLRWECAGALTEAPGGSACGGDGGPGGEPARWAGRLCSAPR
jgi:hypothetical protein